MFGSRNAFLTAAQAVIDPFWKYVSMLLPGTGTNGAQNNTFLDSSTNNFTITRNGNTTQGTFAPYGANWSNYFDGSGDSLTVPDNSAFNLAANNWTIETWVNFSSLPSASGAANFVGQWSGIASDLGYFLYLFNSAGTYQIYFTYSTTGTNQVNLLVNFPSAPSVGTWNHLAVVRSVNNFLVFWNGTQLGTTQTLNATIFNSSRVMSIGLLDVYPLNGYLSNLRIVNGTAVYTANFTPPTAPLTAISGTALLTCQSNRFIDNSANNSTITRNGDVSVQRFSPFNPTEPYAAGVIGGSGYFDGNGDYLALAANSAFQFNTGDFTIEFWSNLSTTGVDDGVFWEARSAGSTPNGFVLNSRLITGGYRINFYTGGIANVTSNSAVFNTWNHIAVTRSSGILRIFLNGVVGLTGTFNNNFAETPNITIGQSLLYGNSNITGYLSNFRVIKGTAVYTANFTPPAAPVTAITNTQLLLNFTNGGIIDNAMMNDLETVGNAQISTSVSKFGSGSMSFDGSGDYLVSNAGTTDLYAFGGGDFTVEMWIYFNSVSSVQCFYDSRPSSTQGAYPFIYLNSDATIRYYVSSADRITSSAVTTGVWYHLAICRVGTNTRMFLNGVQTGSTYTDSTAYLNASGRPLIGINATNITQGFNGYIDDLRITKGVARYTANFTPPSAPFPLR